MKKKFIMRSFLFLINPKLISIVKVLKKCGIKIITSGEPLSILKIQVLSVRIFLNLQRFSEILDGRVKTLHPKIHSGILFDRSKKKHKTQIIKNNFEPIDLIITNFYPFQEALSKTKSDAKIIENIDIGGPAMVRAAAKNYKDVTVITDIEDYFYLTKELKKNKGKTTMKFRERMAAKAFNLVAYYDSLISGWFDEKLNISFPEYKTFLEEK